MQSINSEEWRRRELEQLAEMYNFCEDMMLSSTDPKIKDAAKARINRIAALGTRLGGIQFVTQAYTSRAIAHVQGFKIVSSDENENDNA